MNTYLILKWAHILSSVLLVGTGFGSAFYLYFIHRTRNTQAIAEVSRLVVKADFWFTTPTIIIQPLTGYAMLTTTGYSLNTELAIMDLCFLCSSWCLLATCCLATDTNGKYSNRGCKK